MTLPDRIAASCFTGAEYPQGLHIEPCSFAEWHAHDAYCDCMSALLWPAVFELQRCRAVIADYPALYDPTRWLPHVSQMNNLKACISSLPALQSGIS